METTGIKTNVSFVHPLHFLLKSWRHRHDEKLESKIIRLDSVKNIIPDLTENKIYVHFGNESLSMEKKDVLYFLDRNFKGADNRESILKYEKFKIKNGSMNYFWAYKNDVLLRNDNQIIFANYCTPLRATIFYNSK